MLDRFSTRQPPIPESLLLILMHTPPLALCALIGWLSSQPQAPLPPAWNDKVMHALAFGLLSGLWVRAFWFTTRWPVLQVAVVAALCSAGYGAVDELHQSWVPGRDASGLDLAADALGAVSGALVAGGFFELFARLARSKTS